MAERDVFQLKFFDSIVAGMINQAIGGGAISNPTKTLLTDFNVGSVSRTLMEAAAIEIEQLYLRTQTGIAKAIPVAIYEAFGFTREPSAAATGNATFTKAVGATGIITIPIGTRIQTSTGIEFVTIQAGTIDTAVENDTTVSIKAVLAGTLGNVEANSINFFVTSVQGLSAVTNSLATTGGQEQESDDARKVRFQDFVSNLTRATRRACEVGAESAQLVDAITGAITEQVVHARVYEPFNATDNTVANGGDGLPASYDVGYFEIYIDNGSGTTSAALVTECQQVIDGYNDEGERVAGWKAAGVVATVIAVTPVTVNVTCDIQMKSGYTFDSGYEDTINAAIEEYFNNLEILEKVSWENLLVAISNSSPDIYEVTLTDPSADTAILYNQRGILGSVTVNEVVP